MPPIVAMALSAPLMTRSSSSLSRRRPSSLGAEVVIREVGAELDRQGDHPEAEHHLTVKSAFERIACVRLRQRHPAGKTESDLRLDSACTHQNRHGYGGKQQRDALHGLSLS